MRAQPLDVAVIGAGIVGLATANALLDRNPSLRRIILEAEDRVGAHQTGHNSGVIHSGLYYKPGSLKAKYCAESREAMYRFCEEHGIANERCGKIVVATSAQEIPRLEELHRRGQANGLTGLRWLTPEEIREYEPHAAGIRGLAVPQTGIVDYKGVARTFAQNAINRGCQLKTGARVVGCVQSSSEIVLETTAGAVHCKALVNCAGLQCDRVAALCGVRQGVRIIPFRGEYYELAPASHHLVKNLIYPVPDPEFPFLGVHFTRMIAGGIEAGPNAVLALKREGYRKTDVSIRDVGSMLAFSGFWHMAARYYQTGFGELWRSFSKAAFVHALQRLVPELKPTDVRRGGSGVRAQAVDAKGNLLDDFCIVHAPRMVHVLNAPSPGATSSLSIGKAIADMALRHFD